MKKDDASLVARWNLEQAQFAEDVAAKEIVLLFDGEPNGRMLARQIPELRQLVEARVRAQIAVSDLR